MLRRLILRRSTPLRTGLENSADWSAVLALVDSR
jgi:hypothetical protein